MKEVESGESEEEVEEGVRSRSIDEGLDSLHDPKKSSGLDSRCCEQNQEWKATSGRVVFSG